MIINNNNIFSKAKQNINFILKNNNITNLFIEFKKYCNVFIVGGFIRDILFLNNINYDLDFVIKTKLSDNIDYIFLLFFEKFKKYDNFCCYHKTFSISFMFNNFNININFARKENYSQKKIIFKFKNILLIDDFLRRDFLVNAIYYNIFTEDFIFYKKNNLYNYSFLMPISNNSFNIDPSRFLRGIQLFNKGFIVNHYFFDQNIDKLINKDYSLFIKKRIDKILLMQKNNFNFILNFYLFLMYKNKISNKKIHLIEYFSFLNLLKSNKINLLNFYNSLKFIK